MNNYDLNFESTSFKCSYTTTEQDIQVMPPAQTPQMMAVELL